MARTTRKAPVIRDGFMRSLANDAGLSEAEEYALSARAGVAAGEPQPLALIGRGLKSVIGKVVSRQYAHMLLKDAIGKLKDAGVYEKAAERFPALTVGRLDEISSVPTIRGIRRLRSIVRKLGPRQVVSYVDLLDESGVPVPANRSRVANLYSENESCQALLEDFGIRRFGDRIKICNRCEVPKRMDEFYKLGSTGDPYPYCKECNSGLCGERYRQKRSESAG